MNIERMQLMVTLLKEVQANPPVDTKFNLKVWRVIEDCGTSCCAVGHAIVDSRFNALGLVSENTGTHSFIPLIIHPVTRLPTGEIVQDFFGLTDDQFCHFFMTEGYPNKSRTTIQEVIDRIQQSLDHQPQVLIP